MGDCENTRIGILTVRVEKVRELDHSALEPFGQALLAYWRGDKSAMLIHEFKSGRRKWIPVSIFFRDPSDFLPTENALPYCRGWILVVGAGTGSPCEVENPLPAVSGPTKQHPCYPTFVIALWPLLIPGPDSRETKKSAFLPTNCRALA
jgi:hypothetical protein